MTVLHGLRHGGDHTRSGTAEWALKQLSELTGSQEGYLFFVEDGEPRADRITALASSNGDEVVGAVLLTGRDAIPTRVIRTLVERLASNQSVSTDVGAEVLS